MFTATLFAFQLWPMYQFRPDHNAAFPANRPAVSWSRRLGGKINGGLALSEGTLFVESFGRRVSALDAMTGRVKWSTRVSNVVMTTPIVADGLVVVGTGTSAALEESAAKIVWGRPQGDAIVALDESNGRIRWSYHTIGENMPSPALVRIGSADAIVFANGDNHLRALAVRDGRSIWERSVRGIGTMSSAAAENGRVYVVIGTGASSHVPDRVIAIDAASGNIAWSAPYGNADCSPAIAYGRVFVEGSFYERGRAYNDVAAVDERSGALRWHWYSGPGAFTSAGSDEEGVAAMASDGAFYESIPATNQFVAFDATTGRVRWQIHTDAAVKMSAVESNGRLYFGDTGRTLYVVDARNGRILARRDYPSLFTASSPVIDGRTLYIANDDVVRAIPTTALPE